MKYLRVVVTGVIESTGSTTQARTSYLPNGEPKFFEHCSVQNLILK